MADVLQREFTIAVVGNPNVGKTTLFNALTGLALSTGNYPGVTVERKEGRMRLEEAQAHLVDLPGTYSLSARSPDEMLVVDVLLDQQEGERPIDAVLAVIDATNLSRNLYLVSQLRELGKPLVVALNMCDLAERQRIQLYVDKISQALNVPVVSVCARRRKGIDELRKALAEAVAREGGVPEEGPEFPAQFVEGLSALHEDLLARRDRLGREVPRVEAFRVLVDQGGYAEKRLLKKLGSDFAELLCQRRQEAGAGLATLEARTRYAWIREIVAAGVKHPAHQVVTFSDRVDRVLTHRVFGLAIFLLVMALVFQSIYAWAAPFMDGIEAAIGYVGDTVAGIMPDGVLESLLVDGMIAGVGSVLVFLPQILVLALFIAVLEDVGYLSRAAFLMDRLLSRIGLSGHSFIPLLSSFACAIPGIMATRTISNKRDRIATILVAPLMSCSARLPVYTLLIAAFVPRRSLLGGVINLQGIVLLGIYCLGPALAVPVVLLLKRTFLAGATPPFLLELPTYKWPESRTVGLKVYRQGGEFLRRAGTMIFAMSVITWALAYFPHSSAITTEYEARQAEVAASNLPAPDMAAAVRALEHQMDGAHLRNSFFGRMGRAVEPVVKPLGWDWRIGMATLASFPAREVVIAALGTIFNLGGEAEDEADSLSEAMREATRPDGSPLFTLPVAFSLMVFFALCCQCGATVVMIQRETRAWSWALFTFAYMTVLAYVGAFTAFHLAKLVV